MESTLAIFLLGSVGTAILGILGLVRHVRLRECYASIAALILNAEFMERTMVRGASFSTELRMATVVANLMVAAFLATYSAKYVPQQCSTCGGSARAS